MSNLQEHNDSSPYRIDRSSCHAESPSYRSETSFSRFLEEASRVRPTERQLNWYALGFYAFVHFGPNTYTGLEWGDGTEDPGSFVPHELDCDSWCEAILSAGMKGMILTAKHHDGFCLWPSAYTEHSVKNCPIPGLDVVKEASEACRRHGLKFGFYLSPWDRNSKLYGTPAYNDYYCDQLTELLTGYGDIFCVWFDGACGEGPNGKKQEYDFQRYIDLVRKYQPEAVIFHDKGPDVRWVGNEAGKSRHAEWAVVPSELCSLATVQTGPGPIKGTLEGIYNTAPDPGALSTILYSKGLVFCPPETDMSIRPGWFYHPEESLHSVERLFDTYLRTLGGNGCFNLNIPPMPNGLFDPADVDRLKELGQRIREAFDKELTTGNIMDPELPPFFPSVPTSDLPDELLNSAESNHGITPRVDIHQTALSPTQLSLTLSFPEAITFRYVVLSEDISRGQRVEGFRIQVHSQNGSDMTIHEGTTIGYRRIVSFSNPITTNRLTVTITAARNEVHMLPVQVF
ncbi:MAG: alpha-L-fucosidase [Lachnospiraceae bacterium]|nr:alpha-L-fucosidase [Lachnospiraceae bacterium]